MALIAPVALNASTFAVPTLVAASVSDTFQAPAGPGIAFAVYRNTNASTRTVTVDLQGTDVFGRALVDIANTLAATTGELWIPLYPSMGDSTGVITIALTGSGAPAGVTVGHIKIA